FPPTCCPSAEPALARSERVPLLLRRRLREPALDPEVSVARVNPKRPATREMGRAQPAPAHAQPKAQTDAVTRWQHLRCAGGRRRDTCKGGAPPAWPVSIGRSARTGAMVA